MTSSFVTRSTAKMIYDSNYAGKCPALDIRSQPHHFLVLKGEEN